jgi:Protein of unknown function (DUF2934)
MALWVRANLDESANEPTPRRAPRAPGPGVLNSAAITARVEIPMASTRVRPTKRSPSRTVESASAEPPSAPLRNAIIARKPGFIDLDLRRAMIAEAAYYRAQQRGFEPGHECDDWLAAQDQIDAALALDTTR